MNTNSKEDIIGTTEAVISGYCNRCGGELRHLRADKWICPACGNRAILDSNLFYFDYMEGMQDNDEPA